MVSQLHPADLIYPESDGKPMADNTQQFRWIVVIQQNLDWLFAERADVFVAGDLLWYPVEGDRSLCTAPDVMVALGRPKGDRGSYKQWQEANVAPQVVFEILSPSNTLTEMNKKQVFYNRYGVEEYYLYNPETNDLSGWLRDDQGLDVIDPIADWVSPNLGIRFDLSGPALQLYRPDGQAFLSYSETAQRAEQAEQRLQQERQRADHAEQLLEQERLRAEAMAERLRALGVDPENL
ncbi:MAG TPA: Uma2 family endonuclease [Nodosilinea sp.]|nr:Uma2 family endonuclease [Nodosilinea sp.]